MTPTLLTAPATDIVAIADLKAHLRVTHDAEDALIASLGTAATAYLDGWSGVLGRCIVSQTWQVSVLAGDVVLPFPDVSAVSAAYEAGATALTPESTALGLVVTVTEDCVLTLTCGMSAQLLPIAGLAVKLLVGHWYQNREAAGIAMMETPMALGAIVTAIRWGRV